MTMDEVKQSMNLDLKIECQWACAGGGLPPASSGRWQERRPDVDGQRRTTQEGHWTAAIGVFWLPGGFAARWLCKDPLVPTLMTGQKDGVIGDFHGLTAW